ncbi:unnamed protein product [Plutella xylostella]|uniref:(diamondback moth) hypothetical protein n=1 Tax=Plutella xylostella TaxID=51655 RepID=A0A8S4GED5_PLUXY|nr:unnamed protein product [Plutella xylostella]
MAISTSADKDVEEPMPGYLSLHQTAAGLIIKWTPNQLMNGYTESEGVDKSAGPLCTVYRRACFGPLCVDCVYWAMSLQVLVWEVVYVHVHRSPGGDALILVGQDGVQRPPVHFPKVHHKSSWPVVASVQWQQLPTDILKPGFSGGNCCGQDAVIRHCVGQDGVRPSIHFPKGGHLLSFLSNLETGLLPHGQLDPPLWSQRGTGKVFGRGKGRRRPMPSLCESGETEETDCDEVAGDYVFRIVNNAIADREAMRHSLLERAVSSPPRTPRRTLASTSTTSSDSSTMSVDCPPSAGVNGHPPMNPAAHLPVEQSASIELVCSTMRRQIISRAFYGWLAYCRHLSTVRTHLSGLVQPNIVPDDDTEGGLTEERWRAMSDEHGAVCDKDEVYRLVYYGGVQHDIRREVWPYLLGYYEFGSTAAARAEQDAACRRQYETTMSEWLCVEAIVKQRDREQTAASIARLNEAQGKLKPVENVSCEYETTMSEWLCVEAIVKQRDREQTAASIARLNEAQGKLKPVENVSCEYETTMSEWLCVEPIVKQRDREQTAASIARLNEAQGKLKPVENVSCEYETTMSEWLCVEAIVKQRDREQTAASIARLNEAQGKLKPVENVSCEVFEDDLSVISDNPPVVSPEPSETEKRPENKPVLSRAPSIEDVENIELDTEEKEKDDSIVNGETEKGDSRESVDIDSLKDLNEENEIHIKSPIQNPDLRRESIAEIKRLAEGIVQKGDGRGPLCSVDSGNINFNGNDLRSSLDESLPPPTPHQHQQHSVIVTNPSVDLAASGSPASGSGTANVSPARSPLGVVREESHSAGASFDTLEPSGENKPDNRSNCVSPASSNGGVYSNELVESFALNLHRIEKDVQRCDRNYPFFTDENLDKLRNIMCTYVWDNLEMGYMQGMCDLAAPLLVMMQEEAAAHALFHRLMLRAKDNFPSGQAMDAHFADMRSLIQILDCELYELMHAHGDYTHFYFCYRWFLLDFKRELLYKDVFAAWELIWAARQVSSEHMVLFMALALLETYRDVILANAMDFTDIIKFFNEMAERHDATSVLALARDLVLQVQTLIENK